MRQNNKVVGRRGEDIACEYLLDKGYRLVQRNWSTQFGELDIICWEGENLVFVEVKTKIGCDFGNPEEMVNKGKLSQVKRLGELYTIKNNLSCSCRVDVVAVVLDSDMKKTRLSHYSAVY